jgi:HAD superfamily hydrolase (TIGR01450 family)
VLANRFDAFLIDLDGVIHLGGVPIPGAVETMAALRLAGKDIRFLTNDPRSTCEDRAARLRGMGIAALPAEVVTSAAVTAAYLAANEPRGATAFVIGTSGLRTDLEAAGLRILEGEDGREADVVVVGEHEGFNYHELRVATQAVLNGAHLYGTARDGTFPSSNGPNPASGALLAAVEAAAEVRGVAVGKPEPHMFEAALVGMPDRSRVAVIGDNLEADIAGGLAAGIVTILVLTGNTDRARLAASLIQPDFVLEDLSGLLVEQVAKVPRHSRGRRASAESPRR